MCLINERIEDTEQFLQQCHAYSEQKCDLLDVINEEPQLHSVSYLPNQAVIRTVLYSDKRCTYNENRFDSFAHKSVSHRTSNIRLG